MADTLVEAGIRALLNFAPVLLRVPDNVFVRNVSFLQELAVLSYHLSGDRLLVSDHGPLNGQGELSIDITSQQTALLLQPAGMSE